MIYSLTAGLGYGSETWLADSDGANAKQVLVDPLNIIAFARWSPAGDAIAYIRMADINVPFTVGELWTMDGGGQQPILLDKQADAGHGYALAWSPDGQSIAFVARENGEDILADQQADRLLSNIYVAKPDDGTVVNVTLFREALVENPVWSPDGQFLTFSARIGESADIWAVDMNTQQLRQVTNGADARFPVWVKADQQGRQP
jgi:Tol biopolymer transport system component